MGSEEIGLKDFVEEMDRIDSVVGGASENECSYSQGYLSRQALYCCLTCTTPSSGLSAGFCYACYLNCHNDHEVEEIYTKRQFRCDCGTLPQLLCTLKPDVDNRNTDNIYSQNFQALYCSCARPYPDEDRPEMNSVEMIQCFVCEDWFHDTHLNTVKPEMYEEMACVGCAQKHSFLSVYALPEPEQLDVVGTEIDGKSQIQISCESNIAVKSTQSSEKLLEKPNITAPETNKTDTSVATNSENSLISPENDLKRHCDSTKHAEPLSKKRKVSSSITDCKLGEKLVSDFKAVNRALFFDEKLRESVCQCPTCLDHYTKNKIMFLADPEDSLHQYEERGNQLRAEAEAELNRKIESLPHQAKCDVARVMGSVKNTIHGLLEKIVTEGSEAVGRDQIVDAFKAMAAENNIGDPSIFDKLRRN